MTKRLSLTMIVKNEAATLAACLGSVRDLVEQIIVVDTGSRDATRDIARQHGAQVFDLAWPDSFAAARNESLRHAQGQWLLWLDGDEYFNDTNRAKLRDLLANLPDGNAAFVMHQHSHAGPGSSATRVNQVRLFRNHPAIRWEYRVHEQILPSLRRAGFSLHFTDLAIEHTGYQDAALRRGKLERNLRLLHLDQAERPNDPFTLFNLGWAYVDLGRYAKAIPLLQQSLAHSRPADSITPKLYALLTLCHRRLGQPAEAWAACQAGHIRCPDDAELLFTRGQLCHERGDRAAARACWLQLLPGGGVHLPLPSADGVFTCIDVGLQGPLVRHHLAVLCREEGRLDEAASHWQALLAETPTYLPARLGLAELHLQQARWADFEQCLAELEREPQAALDAAVLRARFHLAHKDFSAARQRLEEIIRQAPQALMPFIYLSHVLLQSGQEPAAEPLLRRIVERDPGQGESWRNLAVLYRRGGRMAEALAAARSGCLHCPHDLDLLLLHGVLLVEAGDALNAENCLLQLLERDSGDGLSRRRRATARHNLGLIYRALGRRSEAMAHWRAALMEAPDFAESRRCLETALPTT